MNRQEEIRTETASLQKRLDRIKGLVEDGEARTAWLESRALVSDAQRLADWIAGWGITPP